MIITFKIINHGSLEYQSAVALREEILRKPLGLTFLPEELKKEKDSIHVVGFKGDEVVATAVLVTEGLSCKMRQVSVKADLHGYGIGSKIMAFCEEYAKIQGCNYIHCHARASSLQFYLKNNYAPNGDYFYEVSIPHIRMSKSLT